MKYVLNFGLSDDWLLENAVTDIVKACGKKFALILALPLLRYVFHETKSYFVPGDLFERIFSEYTGDRHVCSIKKTSLVIEGNKDNLSMKKLKTLH